MTPQPKRTANRLKHYDYSRAGWYFVTVCVKNHLCLLAQVTDYDEACVGDDACIVPQAQHQAAVSLTPLGRIVEAELLCIPGIREYVVMPNHLHCIVCIDGEDGPMRALPPAGGVSKANRALARHLGRRSAPTQGASFPGAGTSPQSLSQRIRIFKARVTRAAGRPLFQRSFYDHVIRNEADYLRIATYIQTNPQKWATDRFYRL